MRVDLADIFAELDALNSKEEFQNKFDRTFNELGFHRYCYLGFKADATRDMMSARTREEPLFLTNVPQGWTERYIGEAYQDADPIVRQCLTERLPVTWTERFKPTPRTDKEKSMYADAVDFDIRRGMTVPIHGPYGELGIVSLYSDLSDRAFLKASDTVRYDVHMASLYLHDAVQKALATRDEVPKPVPLTEREVEILRWTAIGKTAWEIGSILRISERTVNFHLQNLMGKLGVHNKTHAAAKAMSFGLIHA